MINPLKAIDDFIIDRICQPIVDLVQVEVREVCRFCLTGDFVLTLMEAYLQWLNNDLWHHLLPNTLALLSLFFTYFMCDITTGRINPYRELIPYIIFRLMMLAMFIQGLLSYTTHLSLIQFVFLLDKTVYCSFWFFLACNKPRPKKKLKLVGLPAPAL